MQQKQAELLLAQTLAELPQFADPAVAEAKGYHSIGDALTGDEHFMNWAAINGDPHVLDPNFPESLVYDTRAGKRVLEAAMFILPSGYTLDNVPQIGGSLIQWHIHDNLCFTEGDEPVVAGLPPARPAVSGRTSGVHADTDDPRVDHAEPVRPVCGAGGCGCRSGEGGPRAACDHVHGSRTRPSEVRA